jgi:uncharacterized protein YuzB (UPF0349 family)
MKLSDLNESERLRAKVDKNGTVLCIWCEKNPAKVSEYGMLRKCDECSKEKYNVMISIDEPSGRRTY